MHDAARNRLIAVCEDHTNGDDEPPNRIVAISLVDGKVTTLVEGADFYSNPRVSPDGRQLAWLAWNHPNMPWDDTELFVASFDGERLARQVAESGRRSRGIDLSAEWSPDGTLYFVSDRTDWWNLYAERDGKIVPILPMEAEFGAPQWVFGTTTYGFEPDGHIVARYSSGGKWRVVRIDPRTGTHKTLDLPYSYISSVNVAGDSVFATAGGPAVPKHWWRLICPAAARKSFATVRRWNPTPLTFDPRSD